MASSYYVPTATVYHGRGSEFEMLTPPQIEAIAADLTRDARTAIGHRFKVVGAPGPDVFTLQLILVRVIPPRPAYISNGPYDFASSIIGMPNVQPVDAGVLVVSGKFIDAASGKLLVGFVAPVHPQTMDLPNISDPNAAYRFAELASQQFASDLVAAIVRQRQIGQEMQPK